MGFKNKIRNVRMFGMKSYMPNWRYQLLIGIALVAIFFFLGQQFTGTKENSLTGMAIEQDLSEPDNTLATEDQNQEEETQEEDYDTYEYYEYKGECTFNIKNAEDDINDISSYLDNNKDELQKAKDEYQNKLDTLKEEYEPRIEDLEEKCDNNQASLQEVQEQLRQLQEECAF